MLTDRRTDWEREREEDDSILIFMLLSSLHEERKKKVFLFPAVVFPLGSKCENNCFQSSFLVPSFYPAVFFVTAIGTSATGMISAAGDQRKCKLTFLVVMGGEMMIRQNQGFREQ